MKRPFKQILASTFAMGTMIFFVHAVYAAPELYDALDSFNPILWHKADGWANGHPFDNTWRADCVTFSGDELHLQVDIDDQGGEYPYKAGEYRSNDSTFGYGLYEVSMKPAVGSGLMAGSFFMFTWDPWDEIDIEFLGKDTTVVQFNHFKNGVGGNEYLHNLGFDASLDFHTYAFEWLPGSISYYVDGQQVHTTTDNVPSHPGQIMMNIWPGNVRTKKWLGTLNDSILPVYAHYDWVRFTPYASGGEDMTPPAAPTGLTVSPRGPGKLSLDWYDNTESDLASYLVYRATTSSGPYTLIAEQASADSWYTDSGLPSGVTFFYFVTALDISGNEGDPSIENSGTPR